MNSMLSVDPKKGGSSLFGIIALCIGVIAFFTPRLFLSMIMVGIAIFAIIGLVKDSSKIWAILALCLGGLIFYSEFNRVYKGLEIYNVTYRVECGNCEIKRTNETGGEDKFDCRDCNYTETIQLPGDTYTTLSAQANRGFDGRITATILVNDKIVKQERSSGAYSIVSLYCWPKEVDGY